MVPVMCLVAMSVGVLQSEPIVVRSPDGSVAVQFSLEQGRPRYSIWLDGRQVLTPSPLGLVLSNGDLEQGLAWVGASETEPVSDDYTLMHGKQSRVQYRANRRVVRLQNSQGQPLEVILQVSNDGLAFRYRLPGQGGPLSVLREATGFAFAPSTVSWLHPMHDAKTGWERTHPSYEAHYHIEQPVGLPSPYAAGWAFPALFRTEAGDWALLSETAVDETYCASRLAQDSTGGLYRLAFPQAEEHRGPVDPVEPSIRLPFDTPWRLVIVGRDLGAIVQSNLATDVAPPPIDKDWSFVRPGRAGWSWLRHDTAGTYLPVLREYLTMTADLGWEYMLVDADWDRIVGYERIAELARDARAEGVELKLWYNSAGDWNTTPFTPRDRMHLPEVRREEFRRIREMGIRGIKVDFFGGDKQVTMQQYMDILRDAADHQLIVNFHGATLQRGWQRTWPNLMTVEAVKGMEFVTFDQRNADQQARHSTILPFTRNVVGSMDFTPVVMGRSIRGVQRATTPAFELALAVLFESAVQHFGISPSEAVALPEFARDYLRRVPAAWDETRFVAGFPGRDAVLARRSGDNWFIAGINGEDVRKTMQLDLSFLPQGRHGRLITDGAERDTLQASAVDRPSTTRFEVELAPQGGFVLLVPAS